MQDTLKQLRQDIDTIDQQIVDLLVQRFATVVDIWSYKKKHSLPSLDAVRRDSLLQSRILEGKKKWLSEDFIIDIRRRIHEESLDIQK